MYYFIPTSYLRTFVFVLLFIQCTSTLNADIKIDEDAKECASSSLSCSTHRLTRPADLPQLRIFNNFGDNRTITISISSPQTTEDVVVMPGSIRQMGKNNASIFSSDLAVLPSIVPRSVVAEMLTLLRGNEDATNAKGRTTVKLDADPDSVDGMTSQEIFLDNDNLRINQPSKQGGFQQENMEERRELREKLRQLSDPYIEKITSLLHKWYGTEKCDKGNRRICTACYSLIRRYRAGERQSHAPHNDKHSYITVVVSLSDYGKEYNGGLYVSTKNSDRSYVKLNRGDAVAHQGDLHHGVRVLNQRDDGRPSERWSWIMWFRDSDTCEDYEAEWYQKCSEEGNPTCMYLRATHEKNTVDVVHWNQKASDAGHAQASVKLAYAYLKILPSHLPFDIKQAQHLFTEAIKSSNEPDGHYGLANVLLAKISMEIMGHPDPVSRKLATQEAFASPLVMEVIVHLEEAARGGHVFAMFNLGICHLYGYCRTDGQRDPDLAAEWFEASGLPEGLFAKSLYASSMGKKQEAEMWRERASLLGFGSSWRKQARERTGSGGSSGAKLNIQWFPLPTGESPQKF